MKKKKFLISMFLIMFIGFVSGCSNVTTFEKSNEISPTQIETIYNDDDGINKFINKYNDINEEKISGEMISKKIIRGITKDKVICVKNDKLEINIYDNYHVKNEYNISVYVGYINSSNTDTSDYKEQFMNYIRVFDNTLSSSQINSYWENMISEYHSSYKINDIDITLYADNGQITYFKLTKNMEL